MLRRTISLTRKVFVAGGALTPFIGKGNPNFIDKRHPDFGKKDNPNLEEYIKKVTNEALDNVKLDANDIDRLVIGNFVGELFTNQGHLGPGVVGCHPALMYKPAMRVEGACASGALAVQVAYDAIRAGADVALVVGAEVQTNVSARVGGDYLARASHYVRQRKLDEFTFPCLFARRMKHIQESGHFSMEETAMIAAKAYENGNKNPLAHMCRKKISFETANTVSDKNPCFLGNPEYKNFLRITDCSQVSDGAAAVVLVSEEGAAKLGKKSLVEIKTLQSAAGNLFEDPKDMNCMDTSAAAVRKAYEESGLSAKDLEVAEVHDCFALAEILMYEALQLAKYGKGKELIHSGATRLDGRIPVNTGGGLLSFGHPVGATGVKQIMELYRQMKGLCNDYQLKKIPTIGAALNMGGDDKTAVCTILENI